MILFQASYVEFKADAQASASRCMSLFLNDVILDTCLDL
jgi:hypothetical protein